MKNFLVTLIIVLLASCLGKPVKSNHCMLVEKVIISANSEMRFQKTPDGMNLIVLVDTTKDGIPDLELIIKTQPVIEHICYLRLAYPERSIALYHGLVEHNAQTEEWNFNPLNFADACAALK